MRRLNVPWLFLFLLRLVPMLSLAPAFSPSSCVGLGHSNARRPRPRTTPSLLFFSAKNDDGDIVSPVLQNCYADILAYHEKFGHPNIPLPAGRPLVTLRRLKSQDKLVESDIALLDALNFTWHSLEDVYIENTDRFDEFLQRLLDYADNHEGNLSPPKKYDRDPELGAWVTAVRRLYVDGLVAPEHVQQLDNVGFEWVSPRKCGSQFMVRYRQVLEQAQADSDAVFHDPAVIAWIRAQQQKAMELSSTRQHYMAQLLQLDTSNSANDNSDWISWAPSKNDEINKEKQQQQE